MAKPITIPNTFASATSAIPLSQLDQDFSTLANATNDLATYSNYVADTGAADAYIANFPANTNTASLTAGLTIQFKAANANTGASTLNVQVNGSTIGTAAIRYANGSALAAGAIAAGAMVSVMYDGTNFQLINDPAGQSGGDVTGPASATDNAIARFDGATGKLIQNSVVTIADTTGDMSGVGTLSAGNVTVSGTANAATLIVTGNSTLGDASGDTLTITGTTVTTPNGLNFDSNTLVIDAANNRVGVNNATPTTALDVTGTATISTNLAFTGTGNRITGDFSNATFANRVAFQTSTTNGNTAVNVIPNGTGNIGQFQAFASSDPDNSSRFLLSCDGASGIARLTSDRLGTGTFLPIAMYTNNTERLRIDTSGNVGIGTSSPTGGGGGTILNIYGASASTLRLNTTTSTGDLFCSGADFFIQQTSSTGSLIFRTSSSATERMRINAAGDVGIGTAVPSNFAAGGTAVFVINNATSATSSIGVNNSVAWYTKSDSGGSVAGEARNLPLSILTNNTERMRITSTGFVGIGTSSPTYSLQVDSNTANGIFVRDNSNNNAAPLVRVQGNRLDNNGSQTFSGGLVLERLNSNGSTGVVNGNWLGTIYFGGNYDATPNFTYSASIAAAAEANWTSTSAAAAGLAFLTGTSGTALGTANAGYGTERMRIGSDGNILIGNAANPGNNLRYFDLYNTNTGASAGSILRFITSDVTGATTTSADIVKYKNGSFYINNNETNSAAFTGFFVGASERMRITSNGNLLVNTSTARTNFFNSTSSPFVQVEGTTFATSSYSTVRNSNDNAPPFLILAKSRGTTVGSNTVVNDADQLGALSFQGNDGTEFVDAARITASVDGTPGANDMPGRLAFFTTADGASTLTERMRITSGGYVKASNTGTYEGATNLYHEFLTDRNDSIIEIENTATSGNVFGMQIELGGQTPNNTTSKFLSCDDTTNEKCVIYSSGTITNRTGTYNSFSDLKLKQDVVDASSQWDDIKAVRVRKFRLKDDVAANPNAKTMIGVIAQELEQTSAGLIDDCVDKDGEVTKAVKYSILYMKAIKALQEAMERIEKLETKVTQLESK